MTPSPINFLRREVRSRSKSLILHKNKPDSSELLLESKAEGQNDPTEERRCKATSTEQNQFLRRESTQKLPQTERERKELITFG